MSIRVYSVSDHDQRIKAWHDKGLIPIEISVKIGDVLVGFIRPSEAFVKARLLELGLSPHRSQRSRRYGKSTHGRGKRVRRASGQAVAVSRVAA